MQLPIRRECDVLLLHRAVYHHQLHLLRRYLLRIHHQADLQDFLRSLGTNQLPELRHVDRVHRRKLVEYLLAREELHVKVLHPSGHAPLIAQVVDALQKHHPHHLADRNALTTVVRAIKLRELRLHRLSVELLGQKDPFVVHVDETLHRDFEDGHLMLLGCFAYHFASIIYRFLTSI